MTTSHIILLSFIEGLTEFLPISSTGHLILASAVTHISQDVFTKNFNIIIQFGAIMSVMVLYWRRFIQSIDIYKKLFIGFLPAAVLGLLLKNYIDVLLDSVLVVAWTFVLGGFVLIWSDRYFSKQADQGKRIEDLSWRDCLKIGLLQCLAFIPGVSRSGASIIAGLFVGMQRAQATEFSFLLAVPTLTGAAFLKTVKIWPTLDSSQSWSLSLGVLFSFIFALIAIRFFIAVVSRFGFKHFGVYRILMGLLLLLFITG